MLIPFAKTMKQFLGHVLRLCDKVMHRVYVVRIYGNNAHEVKPCIKDMH